MREMSDELKAQLAGLLPVNSDFTITFIPKEYDEIPEDLRPKFLLKPWKSNQIKQFSSLSNNEDKAIALIVGQIIDIQNLYNISTGELVPFEPSEIVNLIPKKVLLSILTELTRISGI